MFGSSSSLGASSSSPFGSTTPAESLLESLPLYSYEPLDSGKNEIRMVKLQAPINSQGPLCGTIIHVPLSAKLHYWALSYCWGSLTEKRTIILDGKKLEITVNLDDALRQLGTSYDMLWVDAICINQEDIPERNREVLRMNEIYSLASGVAVWLGVADKTSDRAMDFLQVLATEAPRFDYEECLRDRDKYRDEWTALKDLSKNGYWSRTWIIQELVVSRRLKVVHCGSKSLPWDNFTNVFDETHARIFGQCILNIVIDAQDYAQFLAGLQGLLVLASPETHLELGSSNAINLLRKTSSFVATDHRDKVYGILGLNEELRELVPHPDYANSKDVVYRDVTKAMLAAGYNLHLICLKAPTHVNQSDVASWVPNWNVRQLWVESPNWLLQAIQDNRIISRYSADACKDAVISFVGEGSILRVRGISYDKVDGLGWTESRGPLLGSEEANSRVYDVVQPDHKQNAYGTDLSTFRALKQLNQELFQRGLSPGNDSFVLELYRKFPSMDGLGADAKHIFRGLQRTMEFNFAGRSLEEWYAMMVRSQRLVLPLASPPSDVEQSVANEIGDRWRWLSTDRGYFGRTHPQTQKGDEIVIVQGCSVPMVLRPCGQHYSVICAAYVQGIMNGEALQGVNDDQMQYFDLA